MTEAELAEIEARAAAAIPSDGLGWETDGLRYYILDRTEEQRWATLRVLETMLSDIPALVAEVRRLRAGLDDLSDPAFVEEEGRSLGGYWCRYCNGCLSYHDEERYRPATLGHADDCVWVKARALLGQATI